MDMPGACSIESQAWVDEDWGLCDPCWDGVSMDSYSGWGMGRYIVINIISSITMLGAFIYTCKFHPDIYVCLKAGKGEFSPSRQPITPTETTDNPSSAPGALVAPATLSELAQKMDDIELSELTEFEEDLFKELLTEQGINVTAKHRLLTEFRAAKAAKAGTETTDNPSAASEEDGFAVRHQPI